VVRKELRHRGQSKDILEMTIYREEGRRESPVRAAEPICLNPAARLLPSSVLLTSRPDGGNLTSFESSTLIGDDIVLSFSPSIPNTYLHSALISLCYENANKPVLTVVYTPTALIKEQERT